MAEARVIHPTHYAVFWAIEATAKSLSGRSTVDAEAGIAAKGAAAASAIAAERAWSRALRLIEEILPGFHHEKVVFWDGLAQARTVVGDLQASRADSAAFGSKRGRDCARARHAVLVKKQAYLCPADPRTLLLSRPPHDGELPQGAHEAFEKAYRASIMVSGAATRPTLEIKALVDSQPTSVHELRARYNANKM